ncbi:MAG: hypothetical protein GJ680_01970 [Alteromonadaceae bacterium]|nr:hypothetical protein [Alteromonadaceae bacterium]
MRALESAIKQLITLREELLLQAHLLQMDLKDEWRTLENKLQKLEHNLEDDLIAISREIGHAEEEYFVGDEQEIESLVEELKTLKAKIRSTKS